MKEIISKSFTNANDKVNIINIVGIYAVEKGINIVYKNKKL